MADTLPAHPTLLPPRRFGALLAATRDASGQTLADLSSGDGQYGLAELESFERGMGLVTDEAAASLCEIYGIAPDTLAPQRSQLIIDVAESEVLLAAYPGEQERFAVDKPNDVLARYLGLVYTLRGIAPGREIPIRDGDVAALAEALQLGTATVNQQLRVLLDSAATAGYRSAFGRRFLLPAAGVVVALCGAGGLILVAAARGDGASDTREATPLTGDLAGQPPADDGPDPSPRRAAATSGSATATAAAAGVELPWLKEAPAQPWARSSDTPGSTWFVPGQSVPGSETAPQATNAPATASATRPAATATPPPATPPPTAPPVTNPPATAPPVTAPTITQPPVTAAPVTAPQVTAPPVTTPPALSDGQTALNTIGFDWQALLPGWTIEIKPSNSGLRGATFPYEKRIEIYERSDDSVGFLTHVIAHEIGHGIDVARLDGVSRTAWLVARGTVGADWWTSPGANDFAVGSGDFAESFAAWRTGGSSRSQLGGAPTQAQIDVMVGLIGW